MRHQLLPLLAAGLLLLFLSGCAHRHSHHRHPSAGALAVVGVVALTAAAIEVAAEAEHSDEVVAHCHDPHLHCCSCH